jgi:hypothetical protein
MSARISAAVLAVLLSSLTGCISDEAGRPFDTSHLSEIRVGQDAAVIRRWFGQPLYAIDLNRNGQCASRWIYYSAPSSLLLVDFDHGGKVCR